MTKKYKIHYSLNWMGPIAPSWIEKNGKHWATGRIDISPTKDNPYGSELGMPVIHGEDWYRFGEWLKTFETDDIWSLSELTEMYERYNPKIRYWKNDI